MFNDLAYYDPTLIQGSLQKLGAAALQKAGGEFGISTSAFSLKMKALDTSAPSALSVGSTNMAVPPLNSLGTGLAASMIQWTTNPYATSSTLTTDTPTLSLNIIDGTGSQLAVKNLSKPISFTWNLNTSDPKFHTPPLYLARCDTDTLYVQMDTEYMISNDAKHLGRGTWSVPCLLDVWKPLNCTSFSQNSVQMFQCPNAILTPECLYWDTNLSKWSSDGCIPSVINSTINCQCTHLTDFTSRVNAIGESNAALFSNAANVYSASGLMKYAEWFGIFGGIAALTVLLGILSMRLDNVITKKYVKELCHDKVIERVFENAPNSAIYIFDKASTRRCTKRKQKTIKKEDETTINLCQRVLQQHNRLHFLFRYDPRLARIFRLLSLFVIQYHSLFITALLYGFTYGGTGKTQMAWYEVLSLSLITSALNIPAIKLVVESLDTIGMKEYQYKFPLLCEEYQRRAEFETLAIEYLKKAPKPMMEDGSINNMVDMVDIVENDEEEGMIDTILVYLCCRPSKDDDEKEEKLSELSRKELLIKMIKLLKRRYGGILLQDAIWSNLPCHTHQGWAFLFLSAAWISWCLNYLLLFAASHEQSVGEGILESYATSEITTIFISQPIIIIITYAIYKVIHTYGKYLPLWLQRYIMIITKHNIPALYYFSNPWKHSAQSPFTAQFAYSLFVRCSALASKTSELAYAPTKAILNELDDESGPCEIEQLYNSLQTYKKEFDIAQSSRPCSNKESW